MEIPMSGSATALTRLWPDGDKKNRGVAPGDRAGTGGVRQFRHYFAAAGGAWDAA
jgi:hypothetical protein